MLILMKVSASATMINFAAQVRELEGVLNVRVVDESEAYERMKNVLGNEAEILGLLRTNPLKHIWN